MHVYRLKIKFHGSREAPTTEETGGTPVRRADSSSEFKITNRTSGPDVVEDVGVAKLHYSNVYWSAYVPPHEAPTSRDDGDSHGIGRFDQRSPRGLPENI